MMSKMEKGYALFVVKPEREETTLNEFHEFLQKRGFVILKKCEKNLTQNDIEKCFFGVFQKNIDYLTSEKCVAFWCGIEAENISDYIYETKMLFRELKGIRKMQLVNLVHSADDGLEMCLQKRLFFPEYTGAKYASGGDMYVVLSEFKNSEELEKKIAYLRRISVVIETSNDLKIVEDLKNKYDIDYIERKEIIFDNSHRGNILKYYKMNNPSIVSKTVIEYPKHFLDKSTLNIWKNYLCYETFYNEVKKYYFDLFKKYDNEIRKKGIEVDGILVEKGEDNLIEANCRYFYAKSINKKMVAGSGKKEYVGEYFMPLEFLNDFWEENT